MLADTVSLDIGRRKIQSGGHAAPESCRVEGSSRADYICVNLLINIICDQVAGVSQYHHRPAEMIFLYLRKDLVDHCDGSGELLQTVFVADLSAGGQDRDVGICKVFITSAADPGLCAQVWQHICEILDLTPFLSLIIVDADNLVGDSPKGQHLGDVSAQMAKADHNNFFAHGISVLSWKISLISS